MSLPPFLFQVKQAPFLFHAHLCMKNRVNTPALAYTPAAELILWLPELALTSLEALKQNLKRQQKFNLKIILSLLFGGPVEVEFSI